MNKTEREIYIYKIPSEFIPFEIASDAHPVFMTHCKFIAEEIKDGHPLLVTMK